MVVVVMNFVDQTIFWCTYYRPVQPLQPLVVQVSKGCNGFFYIFDVQLITKGD